ncbi:cytochrome P450, partial [Dichotomopilus funicola]
IWSADTDTLKDEEIHDTPIQSMSAALSTYGSVVGFKREGNILGIRGIRLLHNGSFFRDIDSIIRAFSTRQMNKIVPEIWPLFEKAAQKAVDTAAGDPVNIQPHLQHAMAEATVKIFLIEKYNRPDFKERMIKVAASIADLTGLNPDRSFLARTFPLLWHAYKVYGIIDIGLHGVFRIVSMIWVTFFLAQYPDCQEAIRKECSSIAGGGGAFKQEGLQSAVLTDSFIREAMRLKGDSVNAVRQCVKTVELDGITVPKGSLVFPFTYQCYRDPDLLANPTDFMPRRWVGTGKSAASTGLEYPAFGYGRWACPGRFLALNGKRPIKHPLTLCCKASNARISCSNGSRDEMLDPRSSGLFTL